MPELTEKEVEQFEKTQKEKENTDIQRVVKGDRVVYKTRDGKFFTSAGDALDHMQHIKQQAEFKVAGLNEKGQTKEQAARADKVNALLEKRTKLQDEINEIDVKIGRIVSGAENLEEEKAKKK